MSFLRKILFLAFLALSFSIPAFAESARHTPTVEVFKKASPSVVNIGTEQIIALKKHPFWGKYGQKLDHLYENQQSQDSYEQVTKFSIGSGVIIHEDGLIITNAHVIHRAQSIFVTLHDGQNLPAQLIALNVVDDLALLKITPSTPLKAIELAQADDIMIGETAIAIGNPYGLNNSVTTGVVSGTKRHFQVPGTDVIFKDLIQTDASINVGNSGGALLNLDGELMGVNLAVVKEADNISFAISVNKIAPLIKSYEEHLESQQRQKNMAEVKTWTF